MRRARCCTSGPVVVPTRARVRHLGGSCRGRARVVGGFAPGCCVWTWWTNRSGPRGACNGAALARNLQNPWHVNSPVPLLGFPSLASREGWRRVRQHIQHRPAARGYASRLGGGPLAEGRRPVCWLPISSARFYRQHWPRRQPDSNPSAACFTPGTQSPSPPSAPQAVTPLGPVSVALSPDAAGPD